MKLSICIFLKLTNGKHVWRLSDFNVLQAGCTLKKEGLVHITAPFNPPNFTSERKVNKGLMRDN
jgi:hypothetical protein